MEIIEPGQVFREGDPADASTCSSRAPWCSRGGSAADDVEISRTSQRGRLRRRLPGLPGGPGAAGLPQLAAGHRAVPVLRPRRGVLRADHDASGSRWRCTCSRGCSSAAADREAVGQRERLLALGSLTAGLTHELNNPAAAAVRATASLRERVAGMRGKLRLIAAGKFERASLEALIELQQRAVEQVSKAPKLSPLETSDARGRAQRLAGGPRHPRRLAARAHVRAGRARHRRGWTRCGDASATQMLERALRWLNYTVETELLMNEIEDATTRISTLVGAAKQYSQLDRAPFQVVDVHDLLDSTLLMLAAKIGTGITVVKDYDRSLPPIPAYAAELNQVWTNLIDNAVSAMNGTGTLTIRTARDGGRRAGRDRRHRPRHPGGDQGPDLRAVLHHQAGRRGHRARPGHRLADRGEQAPRRPAGRVAAWRHPLPGPAPASSRPAGQPEQRPSRNSNRRRRTDDRDTGRRPVRRRRAVPAASSAKRFKAGGCTCAGAAQCGHIGCCDNSPAQHATRHAKETGHPVIRSFEPGEVWFWSYPEEDFYESGPELARAAAPPDGPARPRPGRPGAARTGGLS